MANAFKLGHGHEIGTSAATIHTGAGHPLKPTVIGLTSANV